MRVLKLKYYAIWTLSAPANDNQWCHFERFSTALWCSCSVRPWSGGGGGGGGGLLADHPPPPGLSCTKTLPWLHPLNAAAKLTWAVWFFQIERQIDSTSQNIPDAFSKMSTVNRFLKDGGRREIKVVDRFQWSWPVMWRWGGGHILSLYF